MFKDLYNLSKKANFHSELRQRLESIHSMTQSQIASPKHQNVKDASIDYYHN